VLPPDTSGSGATFQTPAENQVRIACHLVENLEPNKLRKSLVRQGLCRPREYP
jgi:hypothetical protein